MMEQYHHGNLESALINGGLRMITRDGFASFSLRRLSKKLGVSHAAAYRHFSSKEELLRAILQETSRRFNEALCNSVPEDASGEEALMQLGIAYVLFFVKNPEILTLFAMVPAAESLLGGVFQGELHLNKPGNRCGSGTVPDSDFSDHSKHHSFKLFSRIALGLKEVPAYRHLSEKEILLGFWGKVHGIASIIVGQKDFIPADTLEETVSRVCRTRF